jgi:hypothetical protein
MMSVFKKVLIIGSILSLFSGCQYEATANKFLQNFLKDAPISKEEMAEALKEALRFGIQDGVGELGKIDGFFGDEDVKISVPEESKEMLALIIKYKGRKDIDNFVLAMNRAAEDAVPKTANIFISTLNGISIEDAERVLMGRENEATALFRERTRERLIGVIAPIVEESMNNTDVALHYKTVVTVYNKIDNYITSDKTLNTLLNIAMSVTEKEKPTIMSYDEVIEYVIGKTIDGLYLKIEEKERHIRKDVSERTTKLLQRVFKLQDLDSPKEDKKAI